MKPIGFSDADTLATWLRNSNLPDGFILLDGFPGAGKSHIGSQLSQSLTRRWIELDQVTGGLQLSPSRPRYVDLLAEDAIITTAPASGAILDGGTALDVADKFALPVKAHVYVKRLTQHGIWPDEGELLPINPLDRIAPPNALRLCLREYHQRVRPHHRCDALLTWYLTE